MPCSQCGNGLNLRLQHQVSVGRGQGHQTTPHPSCFIEWRQEMPSDSRCPLTLCPHHNLLFAAPPKSPGVPE